MVEMLAMNWLTVVLSIVGSVLGALVIVQIFKSRFLQEDRDDLSSLLATQKLEIAHRDEKILVLDQQQQALKNENQHIQNENAQLREEKAILSTRLQTLQQEITDYKSQLQESFENLSNQILKTRLAELDEKTEKDRLQELKTIESMVKPLQEMILRNDKDTQSLRTQLDTFVNINTRLAEALSNSKGRGDWGELELRRLLEASGVGFEEQQTEGSLLRPDVKVPLTNGRCIYIDAKTVLHNLQLAAAAENQQNETETARQRALHAKALEDEIKKLSLKDYENLIEGSVDFVVLFVPRESMLRVALEEKPTLMDEAFRKNVILASPLILMAILKAVAYEWQQVRLSNDAQAVKNIAVDLHKKADNFIRHFETVGRNINTLQNSYVKAQGSFTGKGGLVTQLRKFEEMGCASKNPLPEELIEVEPLPLPTETASQQLSREHTLSSTETQGVGTVKYSAE